MAVLDDKLHGVVLCVHVCHFALETGITHNSWREDHRKIFRCHLSNTLGKDKRNNDVEHTKFSLSLDATRARWKMRNSRQSRCFGGSMLNVFVRCKHRSWSSSIARKALVVSRIRNQGTYMLIPEFDHRPQRSKEDLEAS